MDRIITNWIAILYFHVYMLAWLSRWLDYDIMVMACRNLWELILSGVITI